MKKLALILALVLSSNLIYSQEKLKQDFVKTDTGYFCIESSNTFKIDTSIVTVKVTDLNKIKNTYTVIRSNHLGYVDILIPNKITFSSFLNQLQNNTSVSSIEVSTFGKYTVINPSPNDPRFNNQWHLSAINAEQAWSITTGNSDVIIAVLDSGVDWLHEDLGKGNDNYQNIHLNTNEDSWINENDPSTGNGIDDDNNGLIDDWKGYNYPLFNNDCRGSYYHGTFVAGIISGKTNNNIGIAGIAGGMGSKGIGILPYCVGENSPVSFIIDDAIIDAVDMGAKVIQLSLTVPQSQSIVDAINYAYSNNAVIICSSGNDYSNSVTFPSSLENVISVGAINKSYSRAPFSNYGENLNVVAPGVDIYSTMLNNNYGTSDGTSFSSPQVSAIAGLIFSVNPNLTSTQVKNIIEQTAQKIGNYSYSNSSAHPNGTWNNQVGYGLVDAYAAVNAALDIDLYTQDKESDNGTEPNTGSLYSILNSPAIWLRRSADNGTEHQIGHNGGVNHVYIRINNKGVTSLGNDTVELYAKKAGAGEYTWNSSWTKVGTACIPSIPAGGSTTVRISATFPNYNRFPIRLDSPDMYYALLTRIKSDLDPMTYNEGTEAPENAYNNNNISYKNVTTSSAVIVDDGIVTDVVITALDNPTDGLFRTSLTFSSPANEEGNPLFKEAEIRLIFPKTLVQSWGSSYILSGAKKVNDSTFLITGSTAKMENISIPANYEGYMMAQVNFLTEEYSEKDKYEYIVEQADPTTGEYQNGLVMIVDKTLRSNLFMAEGGNNVVANANTPANLSATAIGEDAVYNWYNASGALVNSGQNISVTSSTTEKYTLEVIAKADGYKDYDSVYVIRTLGNIASISPNPASGQAVVTYNLASSVSSASIVVTNSSGLPVYNSAINVSATTHTLNVQNLVAGQYSVRLLSATGEVLDTKTLIVQ